MRVHRHATIAPDTGRLDNLEIPVRHELPNKPGELPLRQIARHAVSTAEIFVSFACSNPNSTTFLWKTSGSTKT